MSQNFVYCSVIYWQLEYREQTGASHMAVQLITIWILKYNNVS